jgi:hypothetical protein
MTVETLTSRITYTGAGSTGPYAIPFYFLEEDDLIVVKITISTEAEETLVLNTDYTITGEGDESGGALVLTSALSSLYQLKISRSPDLLQETDYPPSDPFPAESHERAIDKIHMILMAQRDALEDFDDRIDLLEDRVSVLELLGGGGSGTILELNELTINDTFIVLGDSTFETITVNDTATFLGDVDMSNATSVTYLDESIEYNDLSQEVRNILARSGLQGYITATAAANAITITLKTITGGTPSAADPVTVILRDATITSGALTAYQVTAALSTVISSGSTLGCGSAEQVRIHIGAMLNASTGIEFFYWTATVIATTTIRRFDPMALITTTAEGGAGAADSAQTPYSTTARTNQPWTYLGYIEATSGATAGQWASINKIVNWQPGVPMPGDMIQSFSALDSAVATGSTAMPFDDTIPQSSEGDQYMSLAITPKAVMNRLYVYHFGNYATSVDSDTCSIAIFQDSTVGALAAMQRRLWYVVSSHPDSGGISHSMRAGTTSSTTFKIRAGNNQGDAVGRTVTFNGVSGSRRYGGVSASILQIEEYHG